MTVVVYPALVAETGPQGLEARFPDFAGLAVAASTPGDLLQSARERLSQVLQAREAAGEGWPRPSTLAEVRAAHPEDAASLLWVDVTVEDTPVRVTISLGERLLARIDAAAETHGMTRSGYLAACARRQLATGAAPLRGETGQKLFEEVAAAGRRIQETLGPDSPVGRTLAELDAIALDGLRRLAGGMATRRGGARPAESRSKADPDPGPAPDAPMQDEPLREPPRDPAPHDLDPDAPGAPPTP